MSRFRTSLFLTAFLLVAQTASATWSVIALDRASGRVVIASATCVTQQNLERWRSVQDDIFRVMSGAASASRKDQRAEETESDSRV